MVKITSAKFVRGATNDENLIRDGLPQFTFIGRSNVGKSSLINTLVNQKELAKSSSTSGRTKEINFFLVNNAFYFVDLPGYGYSKGSFEMRDTIYARIEGYLFNSNIKHKKVVLIIDAKVGMTAEDEEMFAELENKKKDIIVVINKIDKVNQSEKHKSVNAIKDFVGAFPVVLFSSEKKIGAKELNKLLFSAG